MYDEEGPWYFRNIIDLEYAYSYVISPDEIQYGEIPKGPGRLKDIARIATGKNIRKVPELIKRWGGKVKDWRKMKGRDAQGKEWHWYQKRGDGTKHGLKPKGKPDPF